MNKSDLRGFVYVDYAGEKVEHVRPFIIAKNASNKLIVVNFEDLIRQMPDYEEVKMVSDYDTMQKDGKSCATFSINTIKNCLCDKDFIKAIFDKSIKDLKLNKKILTQYSELFASALNEEKQRKYIDPDSSKINYKALYKGFDLLKKIGGWEECEKNLSEKTKMLVAEIDKRRADFKVEKAAKAGKVVSVDSAVAMQSKASEREID